MYSANTPQLYCTLVQVVQQHTLPQLRMSVIVGAAVFMTVLGLTPTPDSNVPTIASYDGDFSSVMDFTLFRLIFTNISTGLLQDMKVRQIVEGKVSECTIPVQEGGSALADLRNFEDGDFKFSIDYADIARNMSRFIQLKYLLYDPNQNDKFIDEVDFSAPLTSTFIREGLLSGYILLNFTASGSSTGIMASLIFYGSTTSNISVSLVLFGVSLTVILPIITISILTPVAELRYAGERGLPKKVILREILFNFGYMTVSGVFFLIVYPILALLCFITIIGAPFGRKLMNMWLLAAMPYSKAIVRKDDPSQASRTARFNVAFVLTVGMVLIPLHLSLMIAYCCTIVFIPVAIKQFEILRVLIRSGSYTVELTQPSNLITQKTLLSENSRSEATVTMKF